MTGRPERLLRPSLAGVRPFAPALALTLALSIGPGLAGALAAPAAAATAGAAAAAAAAAVGIADQTPPPTAARPATSAASSPYTLEQLMTYTFPSDLVAAPTGQRFAWTLTQRGERSIWIADGPELRARAVVRFTGDQGQELSNLKFTQDGRRLVYVVGGDHGANWPAEGRLAPNPASSATQPKMQVWSVATDGSGGPTLIGDGDTPAPTPDGARVAFERSGEIWIAPIDGSQPATRLFFARGESSTPVWSPDGRTLAFVSDRGSLAYIGLFTSATEPIRYIAPSTNRDDEPVWSPDGTRIAFVRRPGRGGAATPPLQMAPRPWSLWVGDARTGDAREVWRSASTTPGAWTAPTGSNHAWGAGDRLVFLSYQSKQPHLYAVATTGSSAPTGAAASAGASSANRAEARRLTSGDFMVEYVTLTPDRRFAIYNANTGADKDDIERRHLFKVAIDGSQPPTPLTTGTGLEWAPAVSGDGRSLAYFGATAQRPGLPFVQPLDTSASASAPASASGKARGLSDDALPAEFPASRMVTPEHVTFTADDGVTVHGQLFKPAGLAAGTRAPAIVFVHGGPPRQMLLGWHYMFYYANSYALNQYLASRGFVVLSVNYRLGIGYGFDFHQPPNAGARGASEYKDVLASGKYLQARADVDPKRVGIWGGSYGGFLTALGLGRNSDVFVAGVDLHGVHHRVQTPSDTLAVAASIGDGVTPAQLEEAARVAWQSSPASAVPTWKSPVLLIHGDDDRNVRVDQTVDLVQRLRAAGVPFEEMIIPDEVHDFLRYANWLRVNRATAEFFERMLMKSAAAGTPTAASGR